MLLKKIVSSRLNLILIFTFFFFLVRIPALGTDVLNPDAVNWHERSEQFIVGLKTFQLEKTYQHYHPGVTLTWLVGVPVELVKQLTPNKEYTSSNYLMFHTFAKYVLVIVHYLLSLLGIYLLNGVLNKLQSSSDSSIIISILVFLLLSLEPFFLGNSRLVHLDILLSLLMFNGLVASYLALRSSNKYYFILSGLLLGLAFLTKSIGIGSIIFVVGYSLFFLSTKDRFSKRNLLNLSTLITSTVLAIFILFPALWEHPIGTIVNIFDEAGRIGIRNGHEQIFWGIPTEDPGPTFYFWVLLMKLSPATVSGILILLIFSLRKLNLSSLKSTINDIFKKREVSFVFYLSVFYLGYILVMMYPTKKLDRYMLPLYPLLSLYAVLGYYKAISYFKNSNYSKQIYLSLMAILILFIGIPLITFFPYYFTYTSPLFLSTPNANRIIAQKPFGVGIPALKNYLLENYSDKNGVEPTLGFIDTKPMKKIYGNSKVSDIRISGVSDYDLVVLAINEEFPKKVKDSETKFRQDGSFYINGLEYWRIYVKE